MSESLTERAREMVDAIYRAESRRVFATLIRLLGDFDLAEEALHDAFRAALEQWPRDGVPANPRAWLVSAGRFKAIDGIRRRARFVALDDVAEQVEAIADDTPAWDDEGIEDDRLRLIFTCCHPAPVAGRAGGAHAARGLRPHDRGDRAGLPDRARPRWRSASCAPRRRSATRAFPTRCRRRTSCRSGWTACCAWSTSCSTRATRRRRATSLTRDDLSGEAIRLGRLLVELLPEPEAIGLLALMLLQESRRAARSLARGRADPAGRPGPLALEPGADRRGVGAGGARARVAALRPVHAAGGDRGGARRGARAPTRPTGARSSGSTTCCCAPSRRRWSS